MQPDGAAAAVILIVGMWAIGALMFALGTV
jgi:hypothetical protein